MVVKTGQVYWRDEEGTLWLAETYEETDTGETWTTQTNLGDSEVPIKSPEPDPES